MKRVICLLFLAFTLFAAGPVRRAPGFCLIDTSGKWQDLADYRGKVVIVEFMQTNCPHCAAFSGVLNNLKAKYGDRLAILSIANPPDTPQTMVQFVNGHKLSYPLLLDQGQVAASYVRAASVDLPTIFLVDGNGMIRNTWQRNDLNRDVFEGPTLGREIDILLAGAPAATPARK